MSTLKHIVGLIILLSAVSPTPAQESASPPPSAQKYRLELVYIFEAGSTEFVFVIGRAGFKSVAALKSFLSNLPPGSILEWEPGCVRLGGEPLLSSGQEMDDFKAFCDERGIKLVLLPSG